jgi:hypothetical protein
LSSLFVTRRRGRGRKNRELRELEKERFKGSSSSAAIGRWFVDEQRKQNEKNLS